MSTPDPIPEAVKISLVRATGGMATFKVRLRSENHWLFYEFALFEGQNVVFSDGQNISAVPPPVSFEKILRTELTDLEVIGKKISKDKSYE